MFRLRWPSPIKGEGIGRPAIPPRAPRRARWIPAFAGMTGKGGNDGGIGLRGSCLRRNDGGTPERCFGSAQHDNAAPHRLAWRVW